MVYSMYVLIGACFQHSQEKLQNLKRKLQTDREAAYNKRRLLEKDRAERKRIRERKRYQEKKLKSQKNDPVIIITPPTTPQNQANLITTKQSCIVLDSNNKNTLNSPPGPISKSRKNKTKKGHLKNYQQKKKGDGIRKKVRRHRAKIYSDPELHAEL